MHRRTQGQFLHQIYFHLSRVRLLHLAYGRFIVSIVREGVTLTKVGVLFDEEVVQRSEWVGRGADGFPVQEGKMVEVVGKHLIIRRASPVDVFIASPSSTGLGHPITIQPRQGCVYS